MIQEGTHVYWRTAPALTGKVLDVSQWRLQVKVRITSDPFGLTLEGFEFWWPMEYWREQQQGS